MTIADKTMGLPMTANSNGAVHVLNSASQVMREEQRDSRWTLKDLGQKLTVDAISAASAAALVAPIVTVIDKAVAERVSGRISFAGSLRSSLQGLILRPHRFLLARPSAIMMLLYSSTYLTANVVDTMSSTAQGQPASTTSSGLLKFGSVSLVNLSLALYKDSQFTKIFGTISPRPLPPASYALLALRDSLTIFASFNLPPKIAPLLPGSLEDHFSRLSVAQFTSPALMQILNTPLYLFALDLYNRNRTMPIRDRLRKVRHDWPATSLARMCRVIPAFGVGGVVNIRMRASMMSDFDHERAADIDHNV